jgi:hypothetical protein
MAGLSMVFSVVSVIYSVFYIIGCVCNEPNNETDPNIYKACLFLIISCVI